MCAFGEILSLELAYTFCRARLLQHFYLVLCMCVSVCARFRVWRLHTFCRARVLQHFYIVSCMCGCKWLYVVTGEGDGVHGLPSTRAVAFFTSCCVCVCALLEILSLELAYTFCRARVLQQYYMAVFLQYVQYDVQHQENLRFPEVRFRTAGPELLCPCWGRSKREERKRGKRPRKILSDQDYGV